MTAKRKTTRRQKLPCPVCGATSYSWGEIMGTGLVFQRDPTFVSKMFAAGHTLQARQCDECGNVQIFAATEADEGD